MWCARPPRRPVAEEAGATRWPRPADATPGSSRKRSRSLAPRSRRRSADAKGARLMRKVALDHGSARCGAAISDPTGTLATPLGVVERPDTKRGLAAVARLVEDRRAERVVVGLPLTLMGEEGQQ